MSPLIYGGRELLLSFISRTSSVAQPRQIFMFALLKCLKNSPCSCFGRNDIEYERQAIRSTWKTTLGSAG